MATFQSDRFSLTNDRRAAHPADGGTAFLPDLVRRETLLLGRKARRLPPQDAVRTDDDADAMACAFLSSATSGEDAFEDARDEVTAEDVTAPQEDVPAEPTRSG